MPATPIGWRSTIDCWPGRVSVTRPKLLTASPAANRSARGMKCTSSPASPRSLPFSRQRVSTRSPARAS